MLVDNVMVPPDTPATVEMVFVTEVPDQPDGNVHVYDEALFTAVELYVFKLLAQTFVFPLMLAGVPSTPVLTVMLNVCAADEPHVLFAFTVIFPLVDPAVVIIDVVVEVPDQPEGKVQVYDVAPDTAAMLYVIELPAQTEAVPLMVPGVAGMILTVMLWVCKDDEPQALFAFTVIFPPDEPAVVVIDVVVEVPDQPEGKVQV